MKDEILLTLIGLLGTTGTAMVAWFFGRKKTNAEATTLEIDNQIKLTGAYQTMLDDLGQRYETKYLDLEKLYTNKERILKDEINMLKQKVKMLKTENIELKKRVVELEKISK